MENVFENFCSKRKYNWFRQGAWGTLEVLMDILRVHLYADANISVARKIHINL
jgi:hypothetical protein